MLAGFIEALYGAGLVVALSESLDAHRTAQRLGFKDRDILKSGLRAALVKKKDDRKVFDACFERYFSVGRLPQESEHAAAPPPLSPVEAGLQRGALRFALMRAASEVNLQGIRLFTQRGLYVRRLLEAAGMGEVEAALRRAEQEGDGEERDALERHREDMLGQAQEMVARALDLHTARSSQTLRDEALIASPLAQANEQDLDVMARVVKRLARRLAAKHGRQRRLALQGRVHMAGTIRKNLAHDGVLFDVVWKKRRLSKPHLFVLCDVSGSVSAAAKFLLMFLYALSECVQSCRAFVFSSRLAEVSTMMQDATRAKDFASVFQRILRAHGGGSTDYGQAFLDFQEQAGGDINRRSVIIILGDARSNYGDPKAQLLREFSSHAARLLWINPEPQSLWGTGDSEMPRLRAACHAAYPCATIAEMDRIIDGVLKLRV